MIEDVYEFHRRLLKSIPDEKKNEAFEYMIRIYGQLPSCKFAMDYQGCMSKKFGIIEEKVKERYYGSIDGLLIKGGKE